jgi:hypothetical protein
LFLKDLRAFQISVERPLQSATDAFEVADVDLRQAVNKIWQQVTDLHSGAVRVVRERGEIGTHFIADVLPGMRKSALEGRLNEESRLIAKLHRQLAQLKQATLGVRMNYHRIIASVKYLIACTQVTLDLVECSPDSEENMVVRHALIIAFQELKLLQVILEDPSTFWLKLHIIEQALGEITSHQVFQDAARKDIAGFITDVEQFCLQYLVPVSEQLVNFAEDDGETHLNSIFECMHL